jgi:hypothetical protein
MANTDKCINEADVYKNWRWVKHLISWIKYKELLMKRGYIIITFDLE